MQKTWGDAASQFVFGTAAIGLAASKFVAFTAPARELNKALGEVGSLGVGQTGLDMLGQKAKKFTSQFGGNAIDIVRSGYAIQSAIAGLSDNELSEFTYQGAVLAKATKSTSDTITGYMSTMYGAFEKDAEKIGKAKWIDMLTGKTAKAVEIFRTDGTQMQAAFAQLGAAGSSKGIGMDEQMAVIGMLQQVTGSGGVAATQYRAFLGKAGEAATKLGIKAADAAGNMLPMTDILEQIRGKFGDTIDVVEATQLKNAFGSDEAVAAITSLITKTDALKKNIKTLKDIVGSENAKKMAESMTDSLAVFQANIQVLQMTAGSTLLPAVNLVLDILSNIFAKVNWALENIPGLNAVFGIMIGVLTSFGFLFGVFKLFVSFGHAVKALGMSIRLCSVGIRKFHFLTKLHVAWTKICTAAQWLWSTAMKSNTVMLAKVSFAMAFQRLVLVKSAVAQGILTAATWFAGTSFGAAAIAAWSFTVALLACPITWIVIGVMALIGAVVALIVYWDDLNAWIEKITGGAFGLVDVLLFILGPIGWVIFAFRNWDKIVEIVKSVWDYISKFFDAVALGASYLGKALEWLWGGSENTIDVNAVRSEQPVVAEATSARRGGSSDVKAGGVRSTTNNTTNWGGVTINTTTFPGPGELEDWVAMRA